VQALVDGVLLDAENHGDLASGQTVPRGEPDQFPVVLAQGVESPVQSLDLLIGLWSR
jgi:hypothetical protein